MPISRSPKWVRSLSEWGTSFPGRLTQPGDQDLQNWHTHTRQRLPAPVQVYFPSGDHKQCQHRTERGMLLQEKLLLVMFLHTCFPKCNYTLETAKLNAHDNHTTTHYPGKGTGWESMCPPDFFLRKYVATWSAVKRLGPQAEVLQRGLRILHRWEQVFSLAHMDTPCTRSHDAGVRSCQIAFRFYSPLST